MKLKHTLIVLVSSIAPLLTILPTLTPPATAQEEVSIRNGECYSRVIGEEQGSQINMRSGPGTDFEIRGYVLVGQIVNNLTGPASRIVRQDNQGNTWRQVEYLPSRTRGWIRTDFLRQTSCGN
jgi:uncharacterized protein YgiM (DUF1202 family)